MSEGGGEPQQSEGACEIAEHDRDDRLSVQWARPSRGDNGYRSYSDRDVDRLRFIARARRLRLGVDELRELVELWETDDCSSVQHRMAEVVAIRSGEAQRQITELIALAGQLQSVTARLERTPGAGP